MNAKLSIFVNSLMSSRYHVHSWPSHKIWFSTEHASMIYIRFDWRIDLRVYIYNRWIISRSKFSTVYFWIWFNLCKNGLRTNRPTKYTQWKKKIKICIILFIIDKCTLIIKQAQSTENDWVFFFKGILVIVWPRL